MMAAGPDGFRKRHPNNRSGVLLPAIGVNGFCRSSSTDHYLLLLLKPLTPIRFPARDHGPDNPAILLARATAASLRGLRSSNCSNHGEADLLPGLAKRMTDIAPTTNRLRNLSLPASLILSNRCLPPVECSFGVRRSQASKCRPKAKFSGSTVYATVVAIIRPTPCISRATQASQRVNILTVRPWAKKPINLKMVDTGFCQRNKLDSFLTARTAYILPSKACWLTADLLGFFTCENHM